MPAKQADAPRPDASGVAPARSSGQLARRHLEARDRSRAEPRAGCKPSMASTARTNPVDRGEHRGTKNKTNTSRP